MSRRWIGALAVAALFAVACVFLGRWQWHKHEDKVARAERVNSHYFAIPVPLSTAMPGPDADLPPPQEWTLVTATGRYAAQSLLLVRNRPNNGVFGYEVVVPLQLADGASLLVDRGWIPNGASAAEPSTVPATPAGQTTVTGWLRLGEPSLGRQMPKGRLASINLAEARTQTGASLYGAYLIMRDEDGTPGGAGTPARQISALQPLERPDTGEGPHLAYALQWWLGAPVGFALVLAGARREHREGLSRPRVKKTRIWDEEDA
jgi:cytochrome oxidase assembly protein ShyY1